MLRVLAEKEACTYLFTLFFYIFYKDARPL